MSNLKATFRLWARVSRTSCLRAASGEYVRRVGSVGSTSDHLWPSKSCRRRATSVSRPSHLAGRRCTIRRSSSRSSACTGAERKCHRGGSGTRQGHRGHAVCPCDALTQPGHPHQLLEERESERRGGHRGDPGSSIPGSHHYIPRQRSPRAHCACMIPHTRFSLRSKNTRRYIKPGY
jgi:hypothetical protein